MALDPSMDNALSRGHVLDSLILSIDEIRSSARVDRESEA